VGPLWQARAARWRRARVAMGVSAQRYAGRAIKALLGEGVAGERRFFRDWSPWVLCERCLGQLEVFGGV
jgi:hypothetical protein